MERRTLLNDAAKVTLEKRGPDGKEGIRGYASVFYDGTRATEYELFPGLRERIMPGAFDRAIRMGDDARALFNHDPSMLLGRRSARTLVLDADKKGLHYSIDLGQTTVARDVREHVARGDLQGSSFSFEVLDEGFSREDGDLIREVRSVRLFDVGPVTFPAYDTTTTALRAEGDAAEARRALEAFLAGETRAKAAEVRARTLEILMDAPRQPW